MKPIPLYDDRTTTQRGVNAVFEARAEDGRSGAE